MLGNTDADLARVIEDVEPDEVIIAIPSAPGTLRARVARGVPRARDPGPHAADGLRAAADRRRSSSGRCARSQVEDVLGREPVVMEVDRVGAYLNGEVVLVTGAGGSIGVGAVPPDRARRAAPADRARPRRGQPLPDPARARGRPPRPSLDARRRCSPTAARRSAMREVFAEHRPTVVFHAAAYKHVGLMEGNPVEAVRNNALATRRARARRGRQRACDASCSSRPTRRSTPATVMGASKALAEYAVEAESQRFPRHALRDRALRQRARLVGLGRPDLPPPDRARRPGDGHRRADDPLLHDDPGGGAAHHPQRARSARAARSSSSTWASRSRSCSSRKDMIELSGLRPGRGHRDRGRRPPAGREAARGAVQPLRAPAADAGREDPARRARAARPATVDGMFQEINLLVLEGDAAGLARKVSELAGRPRARGDRGRFARHRPIDSAHPP